MKVQMHMYINGKTLQGCTMSNVTNRRRCISDNVKLKHRILHFYDSI